MATGPWGTTAGPPSGHPGEGRGGGRVLLALSGGVDSSVPPHCWPRRWAASSPACFVDHGLMRKNEGDEVETAFSKWDINFVRVDAEARFLISWPASASRSASGRSSARSSSASLRRRPRRSAGWTTWFRAPSTPT